MATMTVERGTIIDRLKNLWEEHAFAFHIPVIDLQHLYLLYTFIELGMVCDQGDESVIAEKYERAFSNILEFTSEHFFVEMEIFRHFNYPESREHLKEHRMFIEKMKKRNREKMEGDSEVARQLVGDLMSWLFDHILQEDKKFLTFFRETGLPIEEYTKTLVDENIIYITPAQLEIYQKVSGNMEMFRIMRENTSMTVYHLWKNYDLELNIPILDIQHLWFLKLMVHMDRVSKMTNKLRKYDELEKTLASLRSCIEANFLTEELYMDHFHYPDANSHKKAHLKLLEVIGEREREAETGDLRSATYLAQDLKEWLLSHIAINDKYFLWFFREYRSDVAALTKQIIESRKVILTKGQINLYRMVKNLQSTAQQNTLASGLQSGSNPRRGRIRI